MKPFIAALQFMTICPFLGRVACDERQIGRGAAWFPVIGLLAGGMVALLDQCLLAAFGPLVASVLSVVALIAVSGGLHADGLADTADGFLSSRPRERILEIMRDSRIGAMGVLAVVAVFALKCAALASLPVELRWRVLLLMPLLGRCSLAWQLAVLPYARTDGGLCSVFVTHRSKLDPVLSALIAGLAGWILFGWGGLASVASGALVLVVFLGWCRVKIGGFTGDTLGAACEILELVPVLTIITWGRLCS